MSRELITIEEYKARKLETLKRIAEALEKLVMCTIPFLPVAIYKEGEKSVVRGDPLSALSTDSIPLPKKGSIDWIVHEGRKYKACKFCDNLVSWNHDTSNYDHFSPAFKYLYPKCNTGGG